MLLSLVSATTFAQSTGEPSLNALDFLVGVWAGQTRPEDPPRTSEFHWARGGFLVGRFWTGQAGASPWRVTHVALLMHRDPVSGHLNAELFGDSHEIIHLHVESVQNHVMQLVTDPASNLQTYRLTYALSNHEELSVKLEAAQPGGEFLTVSDEHLHRQMF